MSFSAVTILNGVLGDWLAQRANPLAISMSFLLRDGAPLDYQAGLASRTVAIFLHGLCESEAVWRFPGQSEQDYGAALAETMGAVPVYVRYNSGLPIGENGVRLAAGLGRLVESTDVARIVLVGHSMGGLVIRSACEQGAGSAWLAKVSDALYLGSPHLGAPLEKGVHLLAGGLAQIPREYFAFGSGLLNMRSRGIRDLRHGKTGEHHEPGARPQLVRGLRHYAVTGSVDERPGSMWSHWFGDALVRAKSGRPMLGVGSEIWAGEKMFPGVNHLALAHHPEVQQQLVEWLG